MDREEIKGFVARRLRRRNIDGLWDLLEAAGYLGDVELGASTVEQLVIKARQAIAVPRSEASAATASPTGPAPEEARTWGLSMLTAAEAERTDAVLQFRHEILDNSLLRPDRVTRWLKEHPDNDRPMTDP